MVPLPQFAYHVHTPPLCIFLIALIRLPNQHNSLEVEHNQYPFVRSKFYQEHPLYHEKKYLYILLYPYLLILAKTQIGAFVLLLHILTHQAYALNIYQYIRHLVFLLFNKKVSKVSNLFNFDNIILSANT